ncbi:MAG: NADH-quinone oxidoreductase subunit B [Dehalococcoidales bacterium]|nr:NADH-quinone oxidoreductase subunit B [Dehalococcoidales bacterium]
MDINIEPVYPEIDAHEAGVIDELKNASAHPLPEPAEWLDEEIKRNVLVTTVDNLLNWGRRNSLWTETSFTACCTFEFISTSSSRFDIARFGMEVLRSSPRHADLMITAGTLTWKMAPQIKRVYDQMAEPKWVIAMGSCGISGGIFADSYSVVPGYNRILPIDVYIPGCPPRPEALLAGIEKLKQKIAKKTLLKK